ncbi:B12-binding domain-containing radical SAM protein [Candidatus Bathyarchaeota archaeon]|nr:B12-binding domain-containing radical SAM protein [Candidatus Bathyarchaeota archaeon]
MNPLIVDANAVGAGVKHATLDVIGSGPRAIAGVLEKRGVEAHIKTAEEALKRTENFSGCDLLLVSGMTSDLPAVKRLVSKWRKHSKGLVLVGGPISSNPRDALVKAGGDIAVIGEAEETLIELIDTRVLESESPLKESLKNIRGVSYLENGSLKINDLRPVMKRTVYDGFTPSTKVIREYPRYYASRVYVEVVRGCSNYLRAKLNSDSTCAKCRRCVEGDFEERFYCPLGLQPGCGYCSVPSLFGPPRSRSVSKISLEIDELLSEGVRRIVLSAPDFLDYGRDVLVEPEPLTNPRQPEPNYELIEGLLSALTSIEAFSKGEASLIVENLKATLVTERAAKLLGKFLAGTPVNIGFETGSEEHGRMIGRSSTPRETLKAISRLKKAGLKPYVYFIHGLPGQTRRTAVESVKSIKESIRVGAERIILYRFQPLPMSAFSDHPPGHPAAKNLSSRMIFEASRRANMRMKEALVGKIIRVVVSEHYKRDPRKYIAYPMLHGPVVLLEAVEGLERRILDAKIVSGIAFTIPLRKTFQAA